MKKRLITYTILFLLLAVSPSYGRGRLQGRGGSLGHTVYDKEGKVIKIGTLNLQNQEDIDILSVEIDPGTGCPDQFIVEKGSIFAAVLKLAYETDSLCEYNLGPSYLFSDYETLTRIAITKSVTQDIKKNEYWYNPVTKTELAVRLDTMKSGTNTVKRYLYAIWRYVWYIYRSVR